MNIGGNEMRVGWEKENGCCPWCGCCRTEDLEDKWENEVLEKCVDCGAVLAREETPKMKVHVLVDKKRTPLEFYSDKKKAVKRWKQLLAESKIRNPNGFLEVWLEEWEENKAPPAETFTFIYTEE